MSTTKILVCCHKPGDFISDDVYTPIQVGKAVSEYDLGILGDDTGDNISSENANFCELTGLYWAWKNMKPVDYIGLCHYRRYFNFNERGTAFRGYTIKRSDELGKLDLTIPDIDKLFGKYDIFMPKAEYYPYSLTIDYAASHVSEDLHTLFDIVDELYPKYGKAMDAVFNKSNKLRPCNMFIMRWADFQDYCKWLFCILFEARKRINIEHYNQRQARIWGYMAERLLSVYAVHNNMKIKSYPLYWINDEERQLSFLHRLEIYIRKELSFFLSRSYH